MGGISTTRDEETERPGRLTRKQIDAILYHHRAGAAISEIERFTGAGRATIFRYTRNVPRLERDETESYRPDVVVPPPPQIIELPKQERNLSPPSAPPPVQVTLGMGIVINFDLIATLKGIAFQEGYEDLNLYFRERLIPWAAALKDFCPKESPVEHFNQVTEIYNDYSKVAQQLVEEKKRKAQPYGTEHLVEIMKILGYSPARIQEEISQLDRMVQVARSMRS